MIKADVTRALTAVTPEDADTNPPNEKEAEALEHLASLVCVDGRSDVAALEARTVDELRDIYKRSKAEGNKRNVEGDGNGKAEDEPIPLKHRTKTFLWADAEVLRSLSEEVPFVKMAEVEYDAEEWRSSSTQEYWGVMRLEVNSVVFMWEELEMREFEHVAPPMEIDAEFLPVYTEDEVEMIPREGREFI